MSCKCLGCQAWPDPVCSICCTYEPQETFRVGALIMELCDSCILRASKEIKRMSRLRQARAEARNKEPGHERQG